MMENSEAVGYSVGVLVVSDTVFNEEKEDRSGDNIASILKSQKYFCLSGLIEGCIPEDLIEIKMWLKHWSDDKRVDLILTVGGTGFSPRDVTPEATRAVIEKEAPHIASYMVMSCCDKTKFAVLSRGVCGIRGGTLILNLPGCSKDSEESFKAIASVLPHAMHQLKQGVPNVVADHSRAQGNDPDGIDKLYDLSNDPDRRLFLDKLIMYHEEKGTPLSQCPTMSRQTLDLYRLYMAVKERGGFVEVMKEKMWKEIAGLMGFSASSGAAYTLRKRYIKHLLPFECKFDRGDIDPGLLISTSETNFRKMAALNAGITSTLITQSISSPVPSVSSPSVPDLMESEQVRNDMGGSQGLPPPHVKDEGSQACNDSASFSLSEERMETTEPDTKPVMSHPLSRNTLPSPNAASMSSFHKEFESVSSSSWPRTPANPITNNRTYHHSIRRPDGMLKLYDLSNDPDRRLFLNRLIMYHEEKGTPLSQCPTISRQTLDFYRLYMAVKERGGFVEVMKGKMWREISDLMGIGASSSVAYTLKKQYIKHLLPFECKYDRGGIDPEPLIRGLVPNSRRNALNAGISSSSVTQRISSPVLPYVILSDGYAVYLREQRSDRISELYSLSNDPDRRLFLDRLIMYHEERGTPLSQCPRISKQLLDLYRLYLAVKERGGFFEVMEEKEMWKEIAGLIGIGASISEVYTLKKHYIKHLLPFECKFDRGGMDPRPLLSLKSDAWQKAKSAGIRFLKGHTQLNMPLSSLRFTQLKEQKRRKIEF